LGNILPSIGRNKNKYDPNNFFNYQQSIGAPISVELAAKQVMLFDKNT